VQSSMHKFANPTQFMRIANAIYPWVAGLAVILFVIGLPIALVTSPPDYQQGDTVRIFYVHVSSAWLMMMIYGIVAVNSAAFLIWRHPMANLMARAAAPMGAVFCGLTLLTGMLWGQPMWGTFWVWDPRLTSTLILFFLYLGYIALGDAFEDSERGDKAAAILALVGSVNIPIIHFSVEWWNSLHQPSIIKMGGFTVDGSILLPLFLMLGAFTCYFFAVLVLRLRSELLAAKIRNARMSQVAVSNTAHAAAE
jgi:heme exporter protein C